MSGEKAGARAGIWRWAAAVGFAYILARPVSNQQILLPVLAMLTAIAAVTVLSGKARIARALNPALLATFVFGFGWLLVGSTNPGFGNAAMVFVVSPAIFWLCAVAVDERMLRLLFHTAAWVTTGLGVVIVIYVAGNTGLLPQVLPAWLLQETGAGFGELGTGATQIRFYAISTLVAAGPMWAASLFVGRDSVLPPQWLRLVATLAALAAGLVAGRRALAVVLILAPLVAWLVKKIVARKGAATKVDGRILIGAVAALTAAVAVAPSLLSGAILSNTWRSVVDFSTSDTSGVGAEQFVRTYQADRLISEWSSSPLMGHGFGHVIQGYYRSQAEPWQFELQYHALLMQTGLLGALVILAGALVMLNAVIKAARARPDLAPTLVVACTAALAMLIANASNPYLQTPGHFWSIFLPVAVANVMLAGLDRSPERLDHHVMAAQRARATEPSR